MAHAYEYRGVRLELLGHAAFRIEGAGVTLYIDPFRIGREYGDGDLVLCTHDHFDHCSPEDIARVARGDAVIVAPGNCRAKLGGLKQEKVIVGAGERREVKGVGVLAVPAYNVNKPYHPRDYGGLGYVVELGGVRVYHAGDTDLIPEMRELGEVDVALLPVSGTYVMTAEEAAEAVRVIRPKVAIPMHYGVIVGSRSDAERFKELAGGLAEVVIL